MTKQPHVCRDCKPVHVEQWTIEEADAHRGLGHRVRNVTNDDEEHAGCQRCGLEGPSVGPWRDGKVGASFDRLCGGCKAWLCFGPSWLNTLGLARDVREARVAGYVHLHRKLSGVLVILALGLFTMPIRAAAQPAVVGVNTHLVSPDLAPEYAAVGFGAVRFDLPWSGVVWADGEHWERFDIMHAALVKARLVPLAILVYDGGPLSEPQHLAEFVRFAGACARRYPGAVFEILNEPNLPEMGQLYIPPAQYVQVVAAVGAAVRADAPGARVIGPALGGGFLDYGYLRDAFAAGLLAHVDAVSLHPYGVGAPERAPEFYANVRAMMRAAGDERPLVVSEWGFLTDEQEQARLLVRAVRVNEREQIGLTILYSWRDTPRFEYGLLREDGTAKPAVRALQAVLR